MTLNTATNDFNLAVYDFSMIGFYTITLKAEARDTTNMNPIPGDTYGHVPTADNS